MFWDCCLSSLPFSLGKMVFYFYFPWLTFAFSPFKGSEHKISSLVVVVQSHHLVLLSSFSVLAATVLQRWDLTLQKVSGRRSSSLGATIIIFLAETSESLFSSSGQHTTQKVVVDFWGIV